YLLYILAVTVVHHNDGMLGFFAHYGNHLLDLLYAKGGPQAVSPGTLDVDHPVTVVGGLGDGVVVRAAVGQKVHLMVGDPELLEGAHATALNSDDRLNGVVGFARNAQHLVPWPQYAEKRHREGMGATDKMMPYKGVLRP